MKTSEYLDMVKLLKGFKTDSDLARFLGITMNQIARYRRELNPDNFGPDMAARIAQILAIDPEKVTGDMMAARAQDSNTRRFWEAAVLAAVSLQLIQFASLYTEAKNQLFVFC